MFRNPVLFAKQYMAVWHLNQDEDAKALMEADHKQLDDLRKARLYRKAHGLPDVSADWGMGVVPDAEDDAIKWKDAKANEEEAKRIAQAKKKKLLFGIWDISG